jgi:hypothetical protein
MVLRRNGWEIIMSNKEYYTDSKPHDGFDEIKVPKCIVNLTIGMLENGERFCKESGDLHGENKYRLLVKALRVALDKHDGRDK